MSEIPDNVISMQEYLNRSSVESITRRLADIALEKLLLQSEQNRLEHRLRILNNEKKTKD